MNLPIIAIRPEPGLSETLAAARERGLEVFGSALFEIRPVDWNTPPDDSFDGLLFGSANAIRHGGHAIERWRGRDAYVVGEKTARVARNAGFHIAHAGSGGLQSLLDQMAGLPHDDTQGFKLLRLAGEKHVPLIPPRGTTIQVRVVYRTVPLPMSESLAERLRKSGTIMLHSGEAAYHFASECDRMGVARGKLRLAALAPRIAEMAGTGWEQVVSVPVPQEDALLALARDICQ